MSSTWIERVMDSNFHFGPARRGEVTAYGARAPDASQTCIFEWAAFMRAQGITRVCCLFDAVQLADFPVNLKAEYKRGYPTLGVRYGSVDFAAAAGLGAWAS